MCRIPHGCATDYDKWIGCKNFRLPLSGICKLNCVFIIISDIYRMKPQFFFLSRIYSLFSDEMEQCDCQGSERWWKRKEWQKRGRVNDRHKKKFLLEKRRAGDAVYSFQNWKKTKRGKNENYARVSFILDCIQYRTADPHVNFIIGQFLSLFAIPLVFLSI